MLQQAQSQAVESQGRTASYYRYGAVVKLTRRRVPLVCNLFNLCSASSVFQYCECCVIIIILILLELNLISSPFSVASLLQCQVSEHRFACIASPFVIMTRSNNSLLHVHIQRF